MMMSLLLRGERVSSSFVCEMTEGGFRFLDDNEELGCDQRFQFDALACFLNR